MRSLDRPFALSALVLASALLSAGVAPETPPPASFSENAEVLAIEVPVTVTIDDKPVRGLKPENFEVTSGKERQAIVGFEVVDLEVGPAAAGPTRSASASVARRPIAAGRRHVLFLFDLGFTQPLALERARRAARQVLGESLDPSDLVAIASYSPTNGARLVLGFTGDRELATRAVDALGNSQLVERSGDPLHLTLAGMAADLSSKAADAADTDEGGGGGDPKEAIAAMHLRVDQEIYDRTRQAADAAERSQRDAARMRVDAMARSYGDLARLLGTIAGRKTVLLLSEGFDSGLLLGSAESTLDREALDAGKIWRIDSDKRFGSSATQGQLGRMIEEFRRAGSVIEAIDVGGLRGVGDIQAQQVGAERVGADQDQSNAGQDGLFVMARETGGDLFRNSNDLGGALQRALGKSSVTYVLTLAPAGLAADGSYHPLTVKLKNGPRGARVAARNGFYAPRPFAERNASERSLEAAGLIIAGEAGGRLGAALLALPLAASAEEPARVPVWLEVDGETLLREHSGEQLNVEIFFYALDERGKVRDHLAQTLKLDLAKLGESLRERGLKIYGELRLPAGGYTLRALVRDGSTGASALRVAAVTVPASDGGVQLLPPVVPEPANKWLNVPANRHGAVALPYPFVVGSRPVMPAAQPVLLTGTDVPVCVFAYGVGEEAGAVHVWLRDAAGKEHEVQATLVDRAPAGAGLERLLLKLHPTRLADGEYSLRVELGAGIETARSTAPVAVVAHEEPVGAASF